MPRPAATALALLLSVSAAMLLASCGEEDAQLLPGETAREITANLDSVQRLADEGDCAGAESAALQVSEQVQALGGVDRRLKQALEQGAARLNEVVAGCQEESEAAVPEVDTTELEATEGDEDEEKREEEREKEEERAEKEQEKEEEQAAKEEEREEGKGEGESGPSLPPQAEGEPGGDDEGPGGEGGGTPSGGVAPAAPAGGGD